MPKPRSTARAVVAAIIVLVALASPVSATNHYGGWASDNTYNGIDGYLRQSTTVALSSSQAHFVWITLCSGICFASWVQTGTYQGSFMGGTSLSAVHVYYENPDHCPIPVYHAGDAGAPAAADYPYYLSWNGGAQSSSLCPDGLEHPYYTIEFRKGSFTSVPFYYGRLSVNAGTVSAKTEIQPDQTVPINSDFYGCDSTMACTNSTYGLHRLTSGSWNLWTTDRHSPISVSNPPWVHAYQTYWAFKTCPTSC